MKKLADYRAPVPRTALKAIVASGKDLEHTFGDLYGTLIHENPNMTSDHEEPDTIKNLTRRQQVLVRIGIFDCQVRNGGVEQFWWNFPHYMIDVRGDIETVQAKETLRNYEKALDTLWGKRKRWMKLLERWGNNLSPDVQDFIESRELLDVDYFDDAYYGEWDGYGTKLSDGLGDELLRCTMAYVLKRPSQFIKG